MKKRNLRHNVPLLLNDKSAFTVVESYKAIRTSLMFKMMNNDNMRCLAFTSSDSSEGKTTTCINLAITFAQAGSRVLIVDADMRRPVAHRYLKVQSKPGLSDKICGFAEEEACIYRTSYENLFLMPAGSSSPSPAELLMSNRMDAFLQVFLKSFDYIFIDTPPVGVVTDAAIIGSKCGGVVFVTRQDVSRKDRIAESIKSLEQAGVNILGFLFNDYVAPSRKGYARRYKNKYGYGYGYEYTDNRNQSESE